ncbi:MAG TPA: GNAT family N-acetyltransferase [Kofleriaceae bacterium]|jgi:putative acetyltransferase
MAAIIRDAVRGDARALVAFVQELAREPDFNAPVAPDELATSVADERDAIEAAAADPRARWLVAEAGGAIVGQLSIKPASPRRALAHVGVLGMSVRLAHRRRGIGRALLAEAIAWAPAAGITRLELYVYARNTAAIALYERAGFLHEGRRRGYVREGDAYLDDLVMARLV